MKKWMLTVVIFAAPALVAQTAVIPVYYCTQGGTKAQLSGMSSTNWQQGIVPSCLVTVYNTGTSVIATTTPQSPFTANTNGSIPPIYAAVNQGYDVVLSGGISPNTYAAPVTLTGLYPASNATIGVSGQPIFPSFIDNTCMADQQAGADMGAKIEACNTAILAGCAAGKNGGIIDATGFQGTQYNSTGILTIGPGAQTSYLTNTQCAVTLKLGWVTMVDTVGGIVTSQFSHVIGQNASVWSQSPVNGNPATIIKAENNAQSELNMVGCTHCVVEGIAIQSEDPESGLIPKTGITIARSNAAGCLDGGAYSCLVGNNTLRNVSVTGWYQSAGIYAVEAELFTMEHVYVNITDSTFYPGGVKPKYAVAVSQYDALGFGLYKASTMTMGSITDSEFWYYPMGVTNSATLYFGGGNYTKDWTFKNLYLVKNDHGSMVEIVTNEGNHATISASDNMNGPIIFDNTDGEAVDVATPPANVFYIHNVAGGYSPAEVDGLRIIGASTAASTTYFIDSAANLNDAYIDSLSFLVNSNTSSFATVYDSTINLPSQNVTMVNALASFIMAGASSACGACGLTVSGTNTSIVIPPYASTGNITLNQAILAYPTWTNTLYSVAGNINLGSGAIQFGNNNVLFYNSGNTYLQPQTTSEYVIVGYNTNATAFGPTGIVNIPGTGALAMGGQTVMQTNNNNNLYIDPPAPTTNTVYIGDLGHCGVALSGVANTPANLSCGVANNFGTLLDYRLTGAYGAPATDPKVQLSDGTGTSGHYAIYDANGGLTNGVLPGTATSITPGTTTIAGGTGYALLGQNGTVLTATAMTAAGDIIGGGASGAPSKTAGCTGAVSTEYALTETTTGGGVSQSIACDNAPHLSAANMSNFPNVPSATTAANLSGTPALPNGTTATTQPANSADAKLATDNTVINAFATPPTAGYGSVTAAPASTTTIKTTTGIAGTGVTTRVLGAASVVGTGATMVCATAYVCDQYSGTFQLTTGTSVTATGVMFTLTFPVTRTNPPNCFVEMFNTASGTMFTAVVPSVTTSTYAIYDATNATASTVYNVVYLCGGY